jgi:hypothetical protein
MSVSGMPIGLLNGSEVNIGMVLTTGDERKEETDGLTISIGAA